MPNLRALNVQCKDDNWIEEDDSILSTDDEYVEYLRQQLPSSYTIMRDSYDFDEIRLWIR